MHCIWCGEGLSWPDGERLGKAILPWEFLVLQTMPTIATFLECFQDQISLLLPMLPSL
jgi:hypothetical protein